MRNYINVMVVVAWCCSTYCCSDWAQLKRDQILIYHAAAYSSDQKEYFEALNKRSARDETKNTRAQ